MKSVFLILLSAMLFVGCSKDGSKSRLMEGGQVTSDPQPTDVNLPGPDQAN